MRRIVHRVAPHHPSRCAHHPPRCTASSVALHPISIALRPIIRRAAPNRPPAAPHHPSRCTASSATLRCIYYCFKAHPPQSRNADREDASCSYRCQPPSHYRSGGANPFIFSQIPLIPPSSVVHSSARFSINSQFSYIFACRKRQILSFPRRRRSCYPTWFRSDAPLPHW